MFCQDSQFSIVIVFCSRANGGNIEAKKCFCYSGYGTLFMLFEQHVEHRKDAGCIYSTRSEITSQRFGFKSTVCFFGKIISKSNA